MNCRFDYFAVSLRLAFVAALLATNPLASYAQDDEEATVEIEEEIVLEDVEKDVLQLRIVGARLSYDLDGRVEKVDFDRKRVTDAQLESLAGLVAVREISIRETNIDGSGLAALGEIGTLKKIDLWYTRVNDAALVHLKKLPNLESLSLGGTSITDAGLATLAEIPSLRELWLYDTGISDAGMAHVAKLTELTTLSLARTKISDAGVKQLKTLTKIERIYLTGTQITDETLKHQNPLIQLRRAYLDNTNITDAGLVHIYDLTALDRLRLSGTQVTEDGIRKLRARLTNTQIDWKPRRRGESDPLPRYDFYSGTHQRYPHLKVFVRGRRVPGTYPHLREHRAKPRLYTMADHQEHTDIDWWKTTWRALPNYDYPEYYNYNPTWYDPVPWSPYYQGPRGDDPGQVRTNRALPYTDGPAVEGEYLGS